MAKVSISENALTILNFLKEHEDENFTSADLGEALGMEKKSVDGIVTAGLQKKGYAERIPAEVELEDGTHKAIKLIKVTDAGRAYDHESAVKADIAAALQK